MIMTYFSKYRGTANGIRYSGETACSLAFPKIIVFVKETYGFRGMILIIGGITMHATVFTLFFRRQRSKVATKSGAPLKKTKLYGTQVNLDKQMISTEDASISSNLLMLFRTPIFYVILVGCVVMHYTQGVFLTIVVDVALDRGSTVDEATSILVYMSFADIVGRLPLPLMADISCVRRIDLVMVCHLLLGLSLVALRLCSSFVVLRIVCLAIATLLACISTMKVVIIADYLGIRMVSYTCGIVGLVVTPLVLANPILVGEALSIPFYCNYLYHAKILLL